LAKKLKKKRYSMTSEQVSTFLVDRLKNRKEYSLTGEDKELIEEGRIVDFIITRLTSGKYRKNKLDEVSRVNIEKRVRIQVENNEPIRLTFPFGGYKNYQMQSYPLVDWAEFFVVAYYSDYMNQIVPFYKPGAVLEFCSDEIALEKIDNVPLDKTQDYNESFSNLIALFSKFLPDNLVIKLVRVRDVYESEDDLWGELAKGMEMTKSNWDNFDEVKKEGRKSMFKLNYIFPNGEGWEQMSENDRGEMMRKNTSFHDAYLALSKRKQLVRGEDKIVIFPFPLPDAVSLGSTKYSVAKFWSGYGALKIVNDQIQDCVMSPDKLALTNFEEVAVSGIDLVGFDKIRVYKDNKNTI